MALPAGILSSCTMCVELSTDGTTWTDFSDWIAVVDPAPVTRDTAEQAVFGEDTYATGVGHRNPAEVTIRSVYTDGSTTADPFHYIWAQWTTNCGGAVAVRWAPSGCTSGSGYQVYSTATATGHYSRLISQTPPGGDAGDAAPIMWEAIVRAPELFRAAYA
jgi:hypothetical protein